MRTLLSHFSKDFQAAVQPVLGPLEATTGSLEAAGQERLDREVLPEVREVRHQLEVLVNKVADQHGFVLIFGPLKSGKSTLMNALSSAYVSEVSSLPAYPCMVYVSHAERRAFTITQYDGGTETLTDLASLQMQIQRAHGDLAAAIRRTEDQGEEFDPAVHYPEAIRRIDVKMPAGDLEESGAVLVDTPGLYSRMKFGYDRMTKEFRNAAACAIFVVKSDNLFLEQVFAEFNELLDLFSRIFLVLNVDSTKMDLGPKGELVPSLEQEDPRRVVEAFENYAMSAPLKRAADEGRLKIYPIDLLRSASRRLAADAGEGDSDEDSVRRASFDSFQTALSDYLNSTDYLVAFVHDSLRRADSLMGELEAVHETEAMRGLYARIRELEGEREAARRVHRAVTALSEYDWDGSFTELEERLAREVQEQATKSSAGSASGLRDAVDDWFETDASLQALSDDDLTPILAEYRDDLRRYALDVLLRETTAPSGGLALPDSIARELALAEVRPEQIARKAIEKVRAALPDESVPTLVTPEDLPVKKRLVDWVLFRSRTAVRRKLVGSNERPTTRISKADKASRLGDPARMEMHLAVDGAGGDYFVQEGMAARKYVLRRFSKTVRAGLREVLEKRAAKIAAELDQLEAETRSAGLVTQRFDELMRVVADARGRIAGIREDEPSDPGLVLTPQAAPAPSGGEPEPAAPLDGDDEVAVELDLESGEEAS